MYETTIYFKLVEVWWYEQITTGLCNYTVVGGGKACIISYFCVMITFIFRRASITSRRMEGKTTKQLRTVNVSWEKLLRKV